MQSSLGINIRSSLVFDICKWWIVFLVWLTNERRLALLPARTIVRDPHHLQYDTLRAGFEPAQNLSSDFECNCAVVINHYTTAPQNALNFLNSNMFADDTNLFYAEENIKITHLWRRWGTPQNLFLKNKWLLKKLLKWANKK